LQQEKKLQPNVSGRRDGQRSTTLFRKSRAAWLGLAAVVCATLVGVGPARPLLRAAAMVVLAKQSVDAQAAGTAPAVRVVPARLDAASESLPVAPAQGASDGPRECRLEAGISTDCIFN